MKYLYIFLCLQYIIFGCILIKNFKMNYNQTFTFEMLTTTI